MTRTQASADRDELLGQAMDEFFESVARGETPDIADYVQRYPDIADLLKVAIPAMRAAETSSPPTESTTSPHTNASHKQLGDFRILHQLGRGGMGIVYEAEQTSMKRRVALKVLPLAGLVDELKIQRFHNEVRAVAALNHPNIVPVYMVGEERGVHYYAMHLIRGRSLAEVITSLQQVRDEGEVLTGESLSQLTRAGEPNEEFAPTELCEARLDDAQPSHLETVAQADESTIPHASRREYFRSVAALGVQAADALQHAHRQGIVHRDIKPANLMLDRSSKLYITDFGLARIEADAGVTMTGDLIGTLRYMAPEQALAKRVDVDHRADIYSLAVTLYELLTLRPAYQAEDRQKLLKQIAFEEPTPLRRIDREIPLELATIVQKAMSKDMDERYSSAEELADDLRRFLEDRPIRAKPPTIPQIVTKWARRNPTIAWAGVLTLLIITIAFGISTLLVAKQRDKAVQATRETEDQLRIATVTRLAAESRSLRDERPTQSVLLAIEAVELSGQHDDAVLPIAHEALLNATQSLRQGRLLTGHGTAISELAMSSDWLVSLGDDKVHLWDLTASEASSSSRALGGDDDKITSMAVSEDGRWLVTGGTKLQRWDLKSPNPDLSPVILAAGNTITCWDLSPDGRWLVAQSEDGTIGLWDLTAANPTSRIFSRQTDLFYQIALSRGGRWVAARLPTTPYNAIRQGTQQNTALLWDLHAQNISSSPVLLEGHTSPINGIAISPDSRWVATGSNKTVRRWDLTVENPGASSRAMPMSGPSDRGGRLVITPDSRWLFSRTIWSSRIHRWDLSAADPASSRSLLRGHSDFVASLATSRDGRWLVSGSHDGTVRVWNLDIDDPSSAALVIRAHDKVRTVAMHPGGRWLATAGKDGTARLWSLQDADPAAPPFVLQGHEDNIFSATAISSNGRWIATSLTDNAVQLWDLETKDPLMFARVLRGPNAIITSMEISPDDRWLVAGCRDGTARLWDLTSKDIPLSVRMLGATSDLSGLRETGTVTIGPNSRWLALTTNDNNFRLWDLNATNPADSLRTLSGHESQVVSIKISADGHWLITGAVRSEAPNLRLWDLHAEDLQSSSRALIPTGLNVYSLAIDANSRWLAAEGSGYTTMLWDLHADDPATSPRVLPATSDRFAGNWPRPKIWRVAISPDARWLFTGRMDETAQLWNLSKETPTPYPLGGHSGVQSVAVSPDGRWLATGGRPNAQLWDLTAPDPTSTARILRGHEEVIWSVRISADSRWLVTDSSDGTIRRWSLDMEWLLNHAREGTGRELTDDEREYYQPNTRR